MDENDGRSEEHRIQSLQTYVLTPVESTANEQATVVDLSILLRAVWRWKFIILLAPMVFAALLFFYRALGNDRYTATATLLIQHRPIENELEPQSLGLETLQMLLMSDAILSKLKHQLSEMGTKPQSTTLEQVRRRLSVDLVPNKSMDRAGQRSYLPMLHLVASSNTPEGAEKTANSWGELFLEESRSLGQLRKKGALDFVDDNFPAVAETLSTVEAELNSTRDTHAALLLEARTNWQARLLAAGIEEDRKEVELRTRIERTERAFQADSDRLDAEHLLETDRLKRDFLSTWQRDIQGDERSIKRRKLAEFKDQLLDVQRDIQQNRENLRELQSEIGKHPEFVVLAKAISDEALWQKVGQQPDNSNLKELADVKLESQSLNPVYQRLLSDLTTTKVKLNTLIPSKANLREEIKALEASVVDLENSFSTQKLAFDALVARRNTAYQNLLRGRQLEFGVLRREHAEQLKELRNTSSVQITRLQSQQEAELHAMNLDAQDAIEGVSREASSAKKTYQLMAEKLEAARLARSDDLIDVQMGVPAVRPEEPQSKNALIWGAAGLLLGLLVALVAVIFFEIALPFLQPGQESSSDSSLAYPMPGTASLGDSKQSPAKLSHNLIKN